MSFFGRIFGRETTVTIKVDESNKKISDDSSTESIEEVLITVNMLKNKQEEILKTEKNEDYERNLFLYNIGFINLKRVKDFIATMNKVDNIEEFNEKERRYRKYGLQFLNTDMVNSLKKMLNLKSEIHSRYDGNLPNSAIDLLKTNYNKLTDDYSHYNFYKRFLKSNTPELVKYRYEIDKFIEGNKKELSSYLRCDNSTDYVYHNSNYWTAALKPMTILYNNLSGLIIIEVEEGYHIVLSDWDNSTQTSDKMNFKEFIKNNIIPKEQ